MCQRCNYTELLEGSHLPSTPNRLTILEIIGNSSFPLSPQEIYKKVRSSHPMNRVTLYRILDLLVRNELLEKISSGDRSFRYGMAPSANHPEHPHFFCNQCGNMECLDPEALRLDIEALRKTFPVLIQKVEIRLDGICKNCMGRSMESEIS